MIINDGEKPSETRISFGHLGYCILTRQTIALKLQA